MQKYEKLTAQLAERVEKSDAAEMLDVVVEFNHPTNTTTQKIMSRSERISALKENFAKQSAPVEEAIQQAGGEVLGKAWINQTLKARLPVKSVSPVSEHAEINVLDLPETLENH